MASSQNKTVPTGVGVEQYFAMLELPRRAEAATLCSLVRDATGETPIMWGSSIVGFGKRLSDVDVDVLRRIIVWSVQRTTELHAS